MATDNPRIRGEIARELSDYTGYTVEACRDFLDGYEAWALDRLLSGEELYIRNICSIHVESRPATPQYDINKGEFVIFPPRIVPRCKFMRSFRDKLDPSNG